MPSLLKSSTTNKAFLRSLLPLLFLLVAVDSARGASLREPRLKGSEPDPENGNLTPNADMLKALEYIESLSQRTSAAPEQWTLLPPGQDGPDTEDVERAGTRLRLASAVQSQSQTGGSEEDEGEEEEGEGNEEEMTQKWLQTILSTLQENQKAPKSAPVHPRAAHSSLGRGGPPAMEEQEEEKEDDSAYQWPQQSPFAGSRLQNKHPPMFEDNEGDNWEEEKGRQALSHDNPFKRTNENVEEKYTPQNLATLQSVFEELGRLTNGKAGHKRQAQDDDDDDEGYEDEDDDMFNPRDQAYEDVAGMKDWLPQEEEEEMRNNRQYNSGLVDDDEDEEDDDEEDEGNYQVKRSNQPSPADDPDDITKLVDYYLLKVLEKTEEQEQKRDLEEEEEEEEERVERRASESQYSGITTPQAIYQLIEISKKLQIPPEDLLDMLKSEDRTPLRGQPQSMMPSEIGRVQGKLTQTPSYTKSKSPPSKLYNRRLPETHRPKSDDVNTEKILNILGLISVGGQTASPLKQQARHKTTQSRFYTPSERQRGYALPQTRLPEKLKDDYDDTVDEDVLAEYLADQLLAQYPVNLIKQRRSSQFSLHDQEEQSNLETFEQAMQDYFDQMDTDKSAPQKRQSETEDMGGAPQTQTLDDEALLKILSYLNPDTEDTEDKDILNKTE